MNRYELEIRRVSRLWCQIEVDVPWTAEVIRDLDQRFPVAGGYSVAIYRATESRRFVESHPGGARLIAVDYVRDPVDMLDRAAS